MKALNSISRRKGIAHIALYALLLAGLLFLLFVARSASAPGRDSPAPKGLPILVYHQILETNSDIVSPTGIRLDRFEEQMRYLAEVGYTFLSMEEVVAVLQQADKIPPRTVAIQFDDSWRSQRLAIDVLEKYNIKASFFVIVGEIGQGSAHLSWSDLSRLAKNKHFGVYSHTLTHPWKKGDTLVDRVRKNAPQELEDQELKKPRLLLEQKLGRPVPYLAWPADAYSEDLIELAKQAGYKALLTTNAGFNYPGQDLFRIHRTPVNGMCDLEAFKATLETAKPCPPLPDMFD